MAQQGFWKWLMVFLIFAYFGSWILPVFTQGLQTGDLKTLIAVVIFALIFYILFVDKKSKVL